MAAIGTLLQLRRFSAPLVLFLAGFVVLNPGHCEEQVPLILWTSERVSLPAQSPPAAGHVVGPQQLAGYLQRALRASPKNVVLFLQDKLISCCVSDELIGQVLSTMKTQSVPYTAIYTALQPSKEAASLSMDSSLGGGRSLLQARGHRERERERERQRKMKEKAQIYAPVEFKEGEDTCVLLWARSLSVSILRSGRWEDHDLTSSTFGEGVSPKLHGSSCDKTRARLVLNYENVLGHRSFKLIFAMTQRLYKVSARRWFTLDALELEYDGTKATFNGSRSVYAPAEYSYRCESVSSFRWPLLVPRSSKDPANQWRVSFQDFQIQGFNVSGSEFSYASDCAGFFSPGIWMGLMTSLLMVLVLTYGLHMIMQLRTMDRFDDPKGPAISVPQTE
ncbi:V-type proton ATPase subunit S1 [Etheostoma cragini]|uniref:V-type proton ATPase subunit S1 n=1 Tax=Etheostoma cragini TaxID=417921 RepID=UPI00155E87B5|nr:V-type proton ATPase subunit S1 [Etheostoma cragini]